LLNNVSLEKFRNIIALACKAEQMKKIIIAIFICPAFSPLLLQAQDYRSVLGIRLSSAPATVNNSISFRYFLNEKSALEALVSFDPAAFGALYERFAPTGATGLQWFYGAGIYAAIDDRNTFGAMGIVGLDYRFQNVPINLSIDWKPELNLVTEVGFEAAAVGFSIRFVFPPRRRSTVMPPVNSETALMRTRL
jgi:hypothetical protein